MAVDSNRDQADTAPRIDDPSAGPKGTSPSLRVAAFDHLVLKCADVETALAWYQQKLGLAPVRAEEWRAGTVPFPSVRVSEHTIIDLIAGESTDGRLDHMCLVVDKIDLAEVAASGVFDVLEGPVQRFGARGDGTSLYVRDPDGTVVELRYYE